MKRIPLWFPFLLALLFLFIGTALFPKIRLISFAPFLALSYNRCTLQKSLWLAVLCGLVADLFCSQSRFGLYALNYGLTTALLYKQKRHFFEDKSLTLPLYSALISCVSTIIDFLLSSTFGKDIPFSRTFVLTDLVLMPCADAIYAYLWFACPIKLYLHFKQVGFRFIWNQLRSYLRLSE